MGETKPVLGPDRWVENEIFVVPDEWIDHNGHMNLARYAEAFYMGARQLSDYLGMTPEFKIRTATASYAAELCISYKREVPAGTELRIKSRVIGYDSKREHGWHQLHLAQDSKLAATGEMMGLNIDRRTRRVDDMPEELLARLETLTELQQHLPTPSGVRLHLS